jgi:hypothetical protein
MSPISVLAMIEPVDKLETPKLVDNSGAAFEVFCINTCFIGNLSL